MARPSRQLGGLVVVLIAINAVSAIQNDQTSLKSSREDVILSASAFTGVERTSSSRHDESLALERTNSNFQLESSKSADKIDRDDRPRTRVVFDDPLLANDDERIDELTSSKYVDQIDGNNIDAKAGEYYRISPTVSETLPGEGEGAPRRASLSSEPLRSVDSSEQPARRRSSDRQSRAPRQGIPRIYSEHAPPAVLQTASPGRQANPDIQDIITGIVKLLNGNVNVAANTVRPLRPIQATRINNRGPPRISDVPPLPLDFDTPGMNPPPPPHPPHPPTQSNHPYPFETPPAPVRPFLNGVPLPEEIVPQGNRPWSWNRPSAGAGRPPPSYKPLPPLDSSFHRDKNENLADEHSDETPHRSKLDERTTQQGITDKTGSNHRDVTTIRNDESSTTTEINENPLASTAKPPVDENIAQVDVDELTNKIQKSPSKEKIKDGDEANGGANDSQDHPTRVNNKIDTLTLTKPMKPVDNDPQNKKPSKIMDKIPSTQSADSSGKITSEQPTTTGNPINVSPTTTLTIETSSSVRVIEPTRSRPIFQTAVISPHPGKSESSLATVALESSEPSEFSVKPTGGASFVPTEILPSTPARTSSSGPPHTPRPTFPKNSATDGFATYRPRPGIVLDDTLDYTGTVGHATQRPPHLPHLPHRYSSLGDIFDVTVSAIQGPGGNSGEAVRVPVTGAGGAAVDVILTSAVEGQGFVSIDGKRTYLNLFDNTDRTAGPTQVQPQPTRTQPPSIGTGFAVPQADGAASTPRPVGPIRRPPFHRRPTQPPVRIDTCIVGDKSTCDAGQHESCATVQGVSACHCKPGYARLQHSLPCKKIVSIVVSMRVDKIYERKVVWDRELSNKDTDSYQTLAYEANRAIESAMSMTPFSDEYMGSVVNNVYQGDVSQGQGGVFVNATLRLLHESRTVRSTLAGELQRHLLGVIHRRNNNIGNSALYVDSPPGSISNLQDLDECASSELNDCHSSAICANTWGGFACTCKPGLKDPRKDDPNESGRTCLSCPSTYCNNRGTCAYQADQMHCTCTGNYYGAQCEVDGEVLGVAIGASVAALVIIVLTLVGLVMWSRRWSREQKAVGSSPVYGYIQGGIPSTLPGTLARVASVGTLASVKQGPPTNLPPYMWAHFGDHMATANVYAGEPMGPTRPSSAMFGYPSLGVHGTLPPVPLPRLQAPPRPRTRHHQPDPDSSDSEPQDRDRADLIPQNSGFHVPRPKSRMSLANQSGIYNDVEYDQGDVHHLSNKNNIPMSTYRPYYRT